MAKKKKKPQKKKKTNYTREIIISLSVLVALPAIIFGVYNYMNYVTSRDWYEKAEKFVDKGQLFNAEKCLHNALLYDDEYSDAYLLKAQLVIGNKPRVYDYGLELVNKAMKFASEPTQEMYYIRGKCYYHLDRFSMAEKDLNKLLEMNAKVDSMYYFLGNISYKNNNLKKAKQYFNKYRAENPESPESYIKPGKMELNRGNYKNARKLFSQLVQVKPDNAMGHYYLGRVYLNEQDTTKACSHLRKAENYGINRNDVFSGVNCSSF